MNIENKNYLLKRLSDTHVSLQETLEGVELEQIIYKDTGWRIRDILGHIATWDREVIHALHAFLEGSEYVIPGLAGDETDFNAQKVIEQRYLSTSEIYDEWNQARDDFKEVVGKIPPDQFSSELPFPWGDESGRISVLINYMIEHNEEHQSEIVEALNETDE
jgi:hypothetical protein